MRKAGVVKIRDPRLTPCDERQKERSDGPLPHLQCVVEGLLVDRSKGGRSVGAGGASTREGADGPTCLPAGMRL